MIKRIVDIDERAYVHLKNLQLRIERDKKTVGSIPIEDLGVLILQHPAIVITQATIIVCQQNNVVILFCDEKHLPYSVMLPVSDGHTLHQKVIQTQIGAKSPLTKKSGSKLCNKKLWSRGKRYLSQVRT